ncbi:hypothetical protein M911_10215 [Ectothiorhodospira haloalkaliphila]|uniref:Uncharacterized protein n=2 Tax=Ectothiorhodospira haloalkaliphila TaxID=421628 RepID=W8KYU5_9GAMM|nr:MULTISPECIES: hypothetical protein [Ectothiorhodospira]AHK80716.1 hypothetical protein M911_10215 [Ectothiorhodospira haloalkaliphila]MCG5495979.1 hypothetical protein [Ectothiorhodospira variabilis]MCG5498221.1 hypothetical protein [Ectothiorhodospira variabilis]MCG5505387.1 hypothetical protein [Ectothiorhodospira variabilis]MCG5508573.1 hypothetical protein [Ectothiorhodospira variabilis]
MLWVAVCVSLVTILVGVWSASLSARSADMTAAAVSRNDFWVRVLGVSLTLFIAERMFRVEQAGLILGFVVWWVALNPIVAFISIFAVMGLRQMVIAIVEPEDPDAGSA